MPPPTVPEPPVRWTAWTPWAGRAQVPHAHLPGVYLLAQFADGPPRLVDPQTREIVYIGEISDGSLAGRWQQFHRAAFAGTPGHTGGLIYHETFGDEGATLYVTAFVPQSLRRDLRALYLRAVAAQLLWAWARRWDGPPVCNSRQ